MPSNHSGWTNGNGYRTFQSKSGYFSQFDRIYKVKAHQNGPALSSLCTCIQNTTAIWRLERRPHVGYLLVEVNVLKDLECLVVVSEERVQSQQAHQAEVAQHLVERVAAKLTGHAVRVTWQHKHVMWPTQTSHVTNTNTSLARRTHVGACFF